MSLTPTLDRIPRSTQCFVLGPAIVALTWLAGYFVYSLTPGFLLPPMGIGLLVSMLLGLLNLWGERRLAKRQRDLIGKCPTCQYDLRASPNRCPECGRAVGDSSGASLSK